MNKLNNLIIILPSIISFMLIISMMMPMKMEMYHPIFMMLSLMTMTFLISSKMNFLKKSMIPFMLFLVMIGGLMVIFIYITSLTSNIFLSFSMEILVKSLKKILPVMVISSLLVMMFYQIILNYPLNMNNMNNSMMFNNTHSCLIFKEKFNIPTYFIMIYLYFSMMCIMNICYKIKIPLRQVYQYYE